MLRFCARLLPVDLLSERNRIRYVGRPKTFGPDVEASRLPLDVIYVALESELDCLEFSLDSVRKNLRHPVASIQIVSPPSAAIREFCERKKVAWRDEEKVMGFPPTQLALRVPGLDRSGWLFQQLIKLSVDRIAMTANVLVLDADTVLVAPQVFEQGGQRVFLVSDEFHLPYRLAYERLLGQTPPMRFSFVAHQMLLDVDALPIFRSELERMRPGTVWWQQILDVYDRREVSGFSEFETYANWYVKAFPGACTFEYWFNIALPRRMVEESKRRTKWPRDVRSVSFHRYLP
jgi:hypothetical protein